jgi:hypothetical protein
MDPPKQDAMDTRDAADLIAELKEDRAEAAADERFSHRAALLIAIMAGVLAIGSLGGGNATDDLVHNNIKASDTWAFYQAKNVRQTAYRLAADEVERRLADPGLAHETRATLETQLAAYRETIARYDNEPDASAPGDSLRGEGKKQLSARARSFERARENAEERDGNFDYAEVVLQLALVLGSVAILANSPRVLALSLALGVLGALLTVNGFVLLFPLPF